MGKARVYKVEINDDRLGMYKISLVDDPAVEADFIALKKQEKQQLFAVENEEKRLLLGVVMRADFPLYRYDPHWGEYYVTYSAEVIRAMAQKYLADGLCNSVNLQHEDGSDVEGVQMVQFFIKDTAKGIAPEAFKQIEEGSLFAEFHVENDEVWQGVKAGEFKGFSLEGLFRLVDTGETLQAARNETKQKDMDILENIKEALRAVLSEQKTQKFKSIATDKGALEWDGEDDLKVGDEVFVQDAEGNRVAAEDGEYVTEDEATIVIKDGVVTEIRETEAELEQEEEEESEDNLAKELAELKKELAELKKEMDAKMKKPMGKAAHERYKEQKTQKEDNFAEMMRRIR